MAEWSTMGFFWKTPSPSERSWRAVRKLLSAANFRTRQKNRMGSLEKTSGNSRATTAFCKECLCFCDSNAL